MNQSNPTNNFNWPDWVPPKVRQQIADFWSERNHRTLADWERSATENNMPRFGQRVRMLSFDKRIVEGRYIHAWNNIGRLVTDDGEIEYVSNPHKLLILGDVPANWEGA